MEADSETVALLHPRRHLNHLCPYVAQTKGPVLLQLCQQDVFHREMQCRFHSGSLLSGDGQKSALAYSG
ncbi:hypothetical protein D3C79_1045860 [compost metagenome]